MDLKKLPKTEFAASIAQLAGERGIDANDILNIIEQGIISAYKRDQKERGVVVDEETNFEVELSPDTGSFEIYQLASDQKTKVTPPGFGRIAAQTAMNVLKQGLTELQNEKLISEYRQRLGTLVHAVVIRTDAAKTIVGLDRETEAVCPREESVFNDNLKPGEKKLFLIKSIDEEPTGKKDIIVSRRDPEFIRQLFVREVPEVANKSVIIEKIARTPGERTKVAVSSAQPGIDPVGSCIGQKGSRVQAVLNELPAEEKVDVILFSKNLSQFVAQALSPAQNVRVISVSDGQAQVTVPEDQLALAIGGGGENVRLAGVLTGLDIKVSKEEAK